MATETPELTAESVLIKGKVDDADAALATMINLFDDTDADKSGSIDEAELTVLIRFQ